MATLERSGGEGRVSEAVNTLATQLSAAVERCGAAETAAAAGRAELSRLRGTVDDAERARDVAAAERDALAARAREGGALAAAEAGRMRLQLEEREKAVLGLRAALDEAGGAAGQQAEVRGQRGEGGEIVTMDQLVLILIYQLLFFSLQLFFTKHSVKLVLKNISK